jgi:hypothetical protein
VTAAHCLSGDNCATYDSQGSTHLGNRWDSPRVERQPPSTAWVSPQWNGRFSMARALPSVCGNSNYSGGDVALVYLDKSELTPRSNRPSFNARVGTGSVTLTNISIAGWSPIGNPTAPGPNSPTTGEFRWRGDIASTDVNRGVGRGGYFIRHDYEPAVQSRQGDSGGPLFYTNADGTRDVIGILASGSDNANPELTTGSETFADITRASNKAWVIANALDSSVNGGHSARWRAQHGKADDFWFGEVDYTGPCRKDVDDDCDGWFDKGTVVHDNCPYVPNAEQEDRNEDGIGDACQLCPWDPKNDEDGDGICADGPGRPPTAAVDNCPRIANRGQENCNALSEMQRAKLTGQAPVLLGDVCDPVPCPKVIEGPSTTTATSSSSYDPEWGGVFAGRTTMSSVRPRPIPSHVKDARGTAIRATNGLLTTHARFCQNLPNRIDSCIQDERNFRDYALEDFPTLADELNDPEKPWHRVTHAPPHPPIPVSRGEIWSWPYSPQSMDGLASLSNVSWNYRADASFWAATAMLPAASSGTPCLSAGTVGEGTCLDGFMWYHADTESGRTSPYAGSTYVGLHGGDTEVANHYFRWAPDQAFISHLKGHGVYRRIFFWEKLIRPLPHDPGAPRMHARPIGISESEVDLLHDNGAGLATSDGLVSPKAAEQLAFGGQYLAPVTEPSGLPRNLDPRIEGMLLSADGASVLGVLTSDANGIRLGEEEGLALSESPGEHSPTPRHGFAAFVSPGLGGLVVVGGLDDATGAPASRLHVYRPGLGWAAPPLRGATIGDVRGAVYSPADGMIWVLETPSEGKLRIMRVSPFSGAVSVAGTYTWDAAASLHHGLAVAGDGTVLVYSSGATSTRVAKLAIVSKRCVAQALDTFEGAHDGPMSGANGEVSLVGLDSQGRVNGVHRKTSLQAAANVLLTGFFQ